MLPILTNIAFVKNRVDQLTQEVANFGNITAIEMPDGQMLGNGYMLLVAGLLQANEDIQHLLTQVSGLIGMELQGGSSTYADLPDPSTMPPGTMYVVKSDENNDGKSTAYIVVDEDGTHVWSFLKEIGVNLENYVSIDRIGQAFGVAPLDASARLPRINMPELTAAEVGAVPTSRTINGMPLEENIVLTADNIGDMFETDPTVPDWAKQPNKPTYTPSEVGAAALNHADASTAHGVSSATEYGHAKASDALPAPLGVANAGTDGGTYANGNHVHAMPTAQNVGAVPLAGGTMTGTLVTGNPDITISAARNIHAGTADMTPGTSPLATGTVYLVYE
jgi:hypothetical protein